MTDILHEAWKHELRDSHGLWVKTGHTVSFKYTDKKGVVKTANGVFIGCKEPGVARIRVTSKSTPMSGRVYQIDQKWVTAVKALLPEYRGPKGNSRPTWHAFKWLEELANKSKQITVAPHELKQGDIVKAHKMFEGNNTNSIGRIVKVSEDRDKKQSHITVRWGNGKAQDIVQPNDKKIFAWRTPDNQEEPRYNQDTTHDKVLPEHEKPKTTTTGIFKEHEPEMRMSEEESNAAENTRLSDLGYDPEKQITVFRGVPRGVKEIKPGDWVTDNEMLAQDYAGDGDVISMKVKHKHLLTDPSVGKGAYTEEMVYRPVEEKATKKPEPKTPIKLDNGHITTDFNDDDLTQKQADSLHWYTDFGFDATDRHIRRGEDVGSSDKAHIGTLLNLIDSSKTTSDSVVYRGRPVVSPERAEALNSLKIGDTIRDPGVQSTTVDLHNGYRYANFLSDPDSPKVAGRYLFKINLPKGSNAYHISDDHASYSYDKEVVLPPNMPMKVKNIEDIDGIRHIEFDANPE